MMTGSEPASAAPVGQQSQTSSSISPRVSTVPSYAILANLRLIPTGGPSGSNSPESKSSASRRPSSHTAPIPPSQGNSDTKPCSVSAPSSFSSPCSTKLRPPSADVAYAMSYAAKLSGAAFSQCAIQTSDVTGTTDGKSAQFTTKSAPVATVRGSLQASPSRTEKRSAVPSSAGSS